MIKYYMIPNSKELETFKEELILPLKDFSIGFDSYFDLSDDKQLKGFSYIETYNYNRNEILVRKS